MPGSVATVGKARSSAVVGPNTGMVINAKTVNIGPDDARMLGFGTVDEKKPVRVVGGRGDDAQDILLRVWNLPARNPGFTGRDGLLAAVQERILTEDRAVVQALHGIGGVGKTQLAIEFAYQFAGSYDMAWWINAEQGGLIGDQFAALGLALGCIDAGAGIDVVQAVVLAKLRERGRWLLIFDNAENPADVRPWLPGGGHVLITSRQSGWDEIAAPVEVDLLMRSESVAILRGRVPGLTESDADGLANWLADLPLAVVQAAGYMARTGITSDEYLRLLRTRAAEIMAQGSPVSYPRSLTAATQLIADRLAVEDPAGLALARICAFLASDPIPQDLFTAVPSELTGELEARAADPLAWGKTVDSLTRHALARVDHRGIQMHRLTQAILRDSLPHGKSAFIRSRAEALLVASAPRPASNPATWPQWTRLIPHILAADLTATENPELRNLACEACDYLIARADFRLARDLASSLYQKFCERLGEDDKDTRSSAHYLAWALREMGDQAAARDIDQDNLGYYRQALGDDHDLTLASANNLAVDLRELGEVEAARELDKDNLEKRRRKLGDNNRLTISSAGNLAFDLRDLGEIEAARELDKETLERCRRVLGDDDPYTLTAGHNLAIDLCFLGEMEAARKLAQNNMERRRRILGDNHPRTLDSANICGFFNLPHNPEAALDSFNKMSQTLDFHNLVTLANTVLALHLLGRDSEALALGSSDTAANLPETRGWMWLVSDDHELKLSDLLDVRVYLQELMRHIESGCTASQC